VKYPSARLDELGLGKKIVSFLRNEWGIEELFPPQSEALPYSLKGDNVMLTIPTASGKSLIAYLTIIHRLVNDLSGQKAIYVVPLKALAKEKFDDLNEIAKKTGLKVGLAIGDREGETSPVNNSDIIVCTSEKLDSLIRTKSKFMDKIGILVIDEFHLINDYGRGPTLEIVLSRIRHRKPDAQIIALSATVGNSEKLSIWLDSKLIKSDWRPVALEYGTLNGMELTIHKIDGQKMEEKADPRIIQGRETQKLSEILNETVKSKGQLLIFVASRASAQKEARDLAKHVIQKSKKNDSIYTVENIDFWSGLSDSLSNRGDSSALGNKLISALKGGVGFHHAGLSSNHREKIESAFRNGEINCLVATPTLAQGINLPARRVIIRDYKRWNASAGTNIPISVMEIKQMMGRAGRPKYDTRGESWILAKSDKEVDYLIERYIHGKPENVISKLSNPNAIRAEEDPYLLTHVLSMISNGDLRDRYSLGRFFEKTFLSTQLSNEDMANRIDNSINWLVNNGMITREGESELVKERMEKYVGKDIEENWEDLRPSWVNSAASIPGLDISEQKGIEKKEYTPRKGPAIFGFTKASRIRFEEIIIPEISTMTYKPTNLGVRVSRLYLNPISGRVIKNGLDKAMSILIGDDRYHQITPLGILHLVVSTPDFLPLWPKASEYQIIQASLHNHSREILTESSDLDEENMKGALVLQSWINEMKYEDIEDKWSVQPGDLRSRAELAEWILYAIKRILYDDEDLKNLNKDAHKLLLESVNEIHKRVRYGCKPDLLGLVSLRGVGRIRARELNNTLGIININDLIMLTENDKYKLSDLRGWSEKLVENIIISAKLLSNKNK
jgi:helicase